ncbi:MAG: J domain-containing protein [Thiohalocapsa sp.]|nr:J domain-containing protein [Thiohalocapsa sp.]MCF7992555.1 J domain-containing protein [Thiohalocapsa sp.]
MVPALVDLALDYYRTPLAYAHLSDLRQPLPRGFEGLFSELGAALSAGRIEDTAALLSTSPAELDKAARFFARHVLLDAAGDYYRCLGLTRDADQDTVRNHYLLLMRMFHPDRLDQPGDADLAYASRINAAYQTLRDPDQRADYDETLKTSPGPRAGSDPRIFFRPALKTLPETDPYHLGAIDAATRRRFAIAALVAALALAFAYLGLKGTETPALRLGQQSPTAPPAPHYLRSSDTRQSTQPRPERPERPANPSPPATAAPASSRISPATAAARAAAPTASPGCPINWIEMQQ